MEPEETNLIFYWSSVIIFLGEPSNQKMSQIMEKLQKGGGGVRTKNQKVQNSKLGLFDKRGGEAIF